MTSHPETHPRAIQGYCGMPWEARRLDFSGCHHSQMYENSKEDVDVASIPLNMVYP